MPGPRRRRGAARSTRRRLDPSRMTLIVGGDLEAVGEDVRSIAESRFGALGAPIPAAESPDDAAASRAARDERIVRVIHRPGAVQTEIRVGHVGLPRLDPGLPRRVGDERDPRRAVQLPPEPQAPRGEGLHLRRRRRASTCAAAPGPFAVRAAVNTEVTVPALQDILAELDAMRDGAADARRAARGARLPRRRVPAPVRDAAGRRRRDRRAADPRPADGRARSLPAGDRGRRPTPTSTPPRAATSGRDELAIVLVGDADAILPALEGAAIGPITVEREELPAAGAAADAA